jgi:SAM-dependent methyltransferase
MIYVADGAAQERDKYAEIWSLPQYREANSPGVHHAENFLKVLNPPIGSYIVDIGCGSGKAGLIFEQHGHRVHYVDITPAGLDPAIMNKPYPAFTESPIWEDWSLVPSCYDYGYCCDVLEHIPPVYTMLACANILYQCNVAWFTICNLPDEFGKLIGEPLHLTVQPFKWWLVHLATLGTVLDARDLCGSSMFVVTRK